MSYRRHPRCNSYVLPLMLGGVLLISGCEYPGAKEAKEASEIIRRHTGGGDNSADAPDPARRGDWTSIPVPIGWELADPFTDQTKYWPEFTFVSAYRDPEGSRRTLLRSPTATQSQIFLIAGEAAPLERSLAGRLAERSSHPLRSRWERITLSTADGVEIELTIHGLSEGVIAGDAVTQVSGIARTGKKALLVDAGGATSTFDTAAALEVVQKLHAGDFINGR